MDSRAAAPYLEHVYRQIPRLFSRGDWEPFSRSFGCCDRTFWAWKFTDFAGARFQESAYALACLYTSPWPGNPLHGCAETLRRLRAAMRYWQRLQYPDGSFDEAYPYEHSLAATAFTGFYVGEALSLVADILPAEESDALRATLARAGDWLLVNDESHGVLSNHLAAAAAALTVIARHTGSAHHAARAGHFLRRIYERQSPEGWYEEYGGADPGYQSHGTFYLARTWQLTGDEELLQSLRRANGFLIHCVHPNRTLGGEYGSRNTEFYFPAGFEMLADVCPNARAIAAHMRAGIAGQSAAGLAAMDAYNFNPLLNNYLFAAANASEAAPPAAPLPFRSPGERRFPHAGLYMRATESYYAVVGLSKGGVVKAFDNEQGCASDCGYWAMLADGHAASSQTLRLTPPSTDGASSLVVETEFSQVKQKLMSPLLFLCFRIFCIVFGKFRMVGYAVKRLLVAALVTNTKPAPLTLHRSIRFTAEAIEITDEIRLREGGKVLGLGSGGKFSAIHMGSSRYFQWQDLRSSSGNGPCPDEDVARLNATGRLGIVKKLLPAGE